MNLLQLESKNDGFPSLDIVPDCAVTVLVRYQIKPNHEPSPASTPLGEAPARLPKVNKKKAKQLSNTE